MILMINVHQHLIIFAASDAVAYWCIYAKVDLAAQWVHNKRKQKVLYFFVRLESSVVILISPINGFGVANLQRFIAVTL